METKVIETHPQNSNLKLIFDYENHSYIDTLGNEYISVTTLVSSFFEKFESEKISYFYAKKHGLSQQEVLEKWKLIGDRAAEKGHEIHRLLYEKFKQKKESNNKQVELIYNDIIKKKKLIPIYLEKILFSYDHNLAGTVDSVFLTPNKDKYIIIDWKTSKQIDYTNKFGKKGFKPFNRYPDCNYIHYSIQLKLYEFLLVTQGYLDPSIPIIYRIVHIGNDHSQSIDIHNDIKDLDISKIVTKKETPGCGCLF